MLITDMLKYLISTMILRSRLYGELLLNTLNGKMSSKTYESIILEIEENVTDGYETAVFGKNGKAVKFGSLISDESELPDIPKNCNFRIWNNDNIDNILASYTRIDK